MGSDESHFNVSIGSDRQSHKAVSTNHNLFEEKGEPKRYRTEVLPLTSLTPYRWAKPAHDLEGVRLFYFFSPLGVLKQDRTARKKKEEKKGEGIGKTPCRNDQEIIRFDSKLNCEHHLVSTSRVPVE